MTDQLFTDEEYQFFIDHGFVILRQCFDAGPGSLIERWRNESWARAQLNPDDPDSWPLKPLVLGGTESVPVKDIAPRAYAAICRLMGGEACLKDKNYSWSNHFLMNYATGADEAWVPCGQASPAGLNWHVDGSWFKHFLDGPEQGILGIVMYSDMESQAGCTCFAPDSIKPIAEYLRQHPEGLLPEEFDWDDLISQCNDFRECTGKAGDVVLMHPFMMHRGSQNLKRIPRFMCNIVTSLEEPMQFNRADGQYSAMEQVILNALGEESLDFHITGQRALLKANRQKITR